MDGLDRQIMHCLQRDGRASFRLIAEVLGISEQTVARRYRTLHADGVVRVVVLPDARALGEQTWFVRIRCRPDAADALADALAARPDVSWVSITAGGGELICVTTSNPDAPNGSVLLHRLPKTSQVLSFTAHCVMHMHVGGEADWLAFDDPLTEEQIALLHRHSAPRPSLPATPGRVRDDDAPLLAALAIDGRAGVSSLAESTGWPPSRVSARLDELFATGAVHVEIDLASRVFGFPTIACLWLTVAPGDLAATGRALSLHPETSFAAAVTGAANLFSVVNCRSPDELYLYVTSKVGALPAIRQAEVVPVLREVKQAAALVRNGRLDIEAAATTIASRPRQSRPAPSLTAGKQ